MKKLKKQNGFTLIEMLIVVAIIAILVAISIPLVNRALERSREATDAANERSFKAVLMMSYLNGKDENDVKFETKTVYAYDAEAGTLCVGTDNKPAVPERGYGKSTSVNVTDEEDRDGKYLIGMIDKDGNVTMGWTDKSATTDWPAATDGITDTNTTKTIYQLMVGDKLN